MKTTTTTTRLTVKLFEFLLPRSWRGRPQSDPERNDGTLARLTESDPVFRALLDHAHQNLERAAAKAIAPNQTAEQRSFASGEAYALFVYINQVVDTRDRAREDLQKRAAQAAVRKEGNLK